MHFYPFKQLLNRAACRIENIASKAVAMVFEAKVVAGRPAWKQAA